MAIAHALGVAAAYPLLGCGAGPLAAPSFLSSAGPEAPKLDVPRFPDWVDVGGELIWEFTDVL